MGPRHDASSQAASTPGAGPLFASTMSLIEKMLASFSLFFAAMANDRLALSLRDMLTGDVSRLRLGVLDPLPAGLDSRGFEGPARGSDVEPFGFLVECEDCLFSG